MTRRPALASSLFALVSSLAACGSHDIGAGAPAASLGSAGSAGGGNAAETTASAGSNAAGRNGAAGRGAGGSVASTAGVGGASGSAATGAAGAALASGTGGVNATAAAYDGKGFVVHEWGTNTIVVGSDGSLQRGLHHEEEDLPSFVYDRLKGGKATPGSVLEKMETPVTYFYSATPRTITAKVGFPAGVLTQWYPAVQAFTPAVAAAYWVPGNPLLDPALDVHFPFMGKMCAATYAHATNGLLDWGNVEILAPDATPAMPPAALEQFTWSYARNVAANPLRVSSAGAGPGGQAEKFLFYRGLGNFPLPWVVTSTAGGGVALANTTKLPLGAAFVLNVAKDRGAFVAHPEGVAAGATLSALAPGLDTAPPLAAYVDELAAAVTDALDATGLFHDESVAMVSTWKRQWFRTPGVRVLYLMPASSIEEQIPLTITPAPDKTVRVMMMRVEVITPELEAGDAQAALAFATDQGGAKAYFDALGRFAEPRLRRALTSTGAAGAALDYLATIATASTTVAPWE